MKARSFGFAPLFMADCHNQGDEAVFLPHFDSKPYGRIAVGRPGLQMRFASGAYIWSQENVNYNF
ncbi:predicted protein [Brucella sp. 83/13]|nr:predicted protein [Brucella sp. 83/13]